MVRLLGLVAVLASVFGDFGSVCANTPIPKPVCDASKTVSVRYSSTSQRIYLESADGARGGCATPTSVHQSLGPLSPLYPLETPGEWMLDESLYVLDGISLNLYGTDIGGDCDYLKLRSDSSMIVNVRAHGGSLDLMNTKVTSWDPSTGDVDSDWADGRSYISAISEVLVVDSVAAEVCEGAAKNSMGEARMDVEGSEIAYLGYEASESWGLSWKLRGICNDKSNRDSYEGIGVYGNILNSEVHHLYYGHYSYRHLNGLFSGNAVHDNEIYGFDPHDDSLRLTISDNTVWNNGNHGIIFSKYCHDALVTNNHVYSNYGVGIFAHYVGDASQIMHNVIEDNGDSGIAFLESSDGFVYNNTVRNNVHGIRFSVGSRDNVIASNVVEDNNGYDLYQYAGNDEVVVVESGSPTRNVFFQNVFSGVVGLRLDDSVDTQFVSNRVSNWVGFEMRDSTNTLILGNTFPADMSYLSTGSCLNAASDVDFGETCSDAPITSPFGQSDLEGMIGKEAVQAAPPSQAPYDSSFSAQPSSAFVGTMGPSVMSSSSSFLLMTPAPTPGSRDVVLSSQQSSGGSGGDDSFVGSSQQSSSSEFESMAPTPSARGVDGVPVVDDDNNDGFAGDTSSGAPSRVVYGIACSAAFALLFIIVVA